MKKRPFKFYLGIAIVLFLIWASVTTVINAIKEDTVIEIRVSSILLYITAYTAGLFVADLLRWCFKKRNRDVQDLSRL